MARRSSTQRASASLVNIGLPNVDPDLFDRPTGARLEGVGTSTHAPRFLMLYGSLRERSYSKLLTLEAARLLQAMGGEVRVFVDRYSERRESATELAKRVNQRSI